MNLCSGRCKFLSITPGEPCLRTHESKTVPGGLIASLAIPWGFSKGDNDLGGYHLVWPRDMVETAGGLLAAGARRALMYLHAIGPS